MPTNATEQPRLYDDAADDLMQTQPATDHVTLLPGDESRHSIGTRLRIMWGQHMLPDVVDGRYRSVVCAVNDVDNSHGIIAQLVNLVSTSQWTVESVTNYARIFHESAYIHAARDHEPYILKFDLDSILVLAMLRPKGHDHFTLQDLGRGFRTITKMLYGRSDRAPVAAVSFLGANSNRLLDHDGHEPTLETVLRTIHEAGFRGDVYPSPQMWHAGGTGVFASYPYPESVERMRGGSS